MLGSTPYSARGCFVSDMVAMSKVGNGLRERRNCEGTEYVDVEDKRDGIQPGSARNIGHKTALPCFMARKPALASCRLLK